MCDEGHLNYHDNKFKVAALYFEDALAKVEISNDKDKHASKINLCKNIARCYYKLGENDKGKAYIDKAMSYQNYLNEEKKMHLPSGKNYLERLNYILLSAKNMRSNIDDSRIITPYKIKMEPTRGHSPTLFAKNVTSESVSKSAIVNQQFGLQSLLQEADISINTTQDKGFVQIVFTDHKLVQEFANELHKIGISNLAMKDETRKPEVIQGTGTIQDKYVILLTADEYNAVTNKEDAYAKLVSDNASQSSFRLQA